MKVTLDIAVLVNTLKALKEAREELYMLAAEPVGSGRYRHLDAPIAEAEKAISDMEVL